MDMPLHPMWQDIGLRLALTMLAGAIVGFNRGAQGHAAGFRTTILVGLAASVAMIQANLLLPLIGKTAGSFPVMDLMRLPLGILTSVGFIGGGTILKRSDLVSGVTTAATLWVITVIGLCFGGGQLEFGSITTFLAVMTLWGLKWADIRIPRQHRAELAIKADEYSLAAAELADVIASSGYKAQFCRMSRSGDGEELWSRSVGPVRKKPFRHSPS
ncbi:MAG TPA: MgtC/SapB family protein [Methylocella sp.]|nr:MgtC/SapB family protein [Methylocella sp.]